MPLISKPNYNQIFASQAPEQDKPAVFNNYPLGWGVESRPNNGKPTIKGFNYLQQTSDLKDLWILQNGACLPYDETIEYAEGAPVLKDGVIQYKTSDGFKSRDSVTIPTYNSAADGVDPVTGVVDGAYFNVRSSSDELYVDEYQNVGGVPTPSGKSYPSNQGVEDKIRSIRQVSVKDYMTQAQLTDCLLPNPILDHSDAFQAAVDDAIAKGTQGIFIPFDRGEIYNLNQTVNLNVAGFTIKGNRNPSYFRGNDGWRGYIRAPKTVTEFFNYNNGAGPGVYLSDQLVVDGIAALSYDRVNLSQRTQTFIAHDANNNGPHRGILFSRVSAHGFNSVLDIVEGDPTTNIAAASVVFENGCVFQNNNATGRANGRTFGLRVSGIQSENGSKFVGRWDGPVTICDNMLEGQSNVIDIDANQTSLIIENNYMEYSSGDFFARLKGTTQNCVFDERPNFVSTINSTDFYLLNGVCKVISNAQYQTRSDRKSLITLNQLTMPYGSKFNGACYTGVNRDATPTDGFIGYCDPLPLKKAQGAVTNKNLGIDVFETPFGATKTGLSVTGDSAYLAVDRPYSIGDVVIFTALIKLNGKFSPTINLYNQDFTSHGSISQLVVQDTGVDDWYVATWCRATRIAGTGVRARFSTGVNNMYVAAIGIDVIPQSEFETFNNVLRAPVQIFNPYIKTTADIEQDRTVSFGTIAAGSTATPTTKSFTLTLNNVRQGDDVRINVIGDLLGTTLSWSVTSDNTITAILSNTQESEKAIGVLPVKIRVIK